jgi:cobalt-zinc-cadmium efflux system membrane fusion protein
MNARNTILIPLLCVVVAAAAAGGFFAWRADLLVPPKRPAAQDDHDHGEHEGHDDHQDEFVRLTDEEMLEFGVEVAVAGPGSMATETTLPGEIRLNADTVTHVTPQIGGVVREVQATLGDRVRAGQVLAVLESREIAQAKAAYLSQLERMSLVEAAFAREEALWKERRITSEQQYLAARQALAEARIELRAAENQLHALGYSEEYLRSLSESPEMSYARLEVAAPRDGVIVEKHVTLGEVVREDSDIFTLADLSTVWVDLRVYPKDLANVRAGQEVTITADAIPTPATGAIVYLSPIVDEHTRTALARVVLSNVNGDWRPGVFVTGRLAVDRVDVDVLIPKTALQDVDGRQSVFVLSEKGFAPAAVTLGRGSATHVEVVEGLATGTSYAARGAFTLVSEMEKAGFGHAGHAH